MSDYSRIIGDSARGIGDAAARVGISTPLTIGVSGATALGLGAWGIIKDKKTGGDAVVPGLAIGLGSVGLAGAINDFAGFTTDSPLKKDKYAYPLLGLILVITIAISSQNIDKSKDRKDDEEKARFYVSLAALLITLFSVIGMVAAKFAK